MEKRSMSVVFSQNGDDRECDININDILKMLFTRKGAFLRCDQTLIDFLKNHLETHHFPKLSKTIPRGYMLNIGKNHYNDYNAETGEMIGKHWEGCIMIFDPGANDPDNDIPIEVFHLDNNFNIV